MPRRGLKEQAGIAAAQRNMGGDSKKSPRTPGTNTPSQSVAARKRAGGRDSERQKPRLDPKRKGEALSTQKNGRGGKNLGLIKKEREGAWLIGNKNCRRGSKGEGREKSEKFDGGKTDQYLREGREVAQEEPSCNHGEQYPTSSSYLLGKNKKKEEEQK